MSQDKLNGSSRLTLIGQLRDHYVNPDVTDFEPAKKEFRLPCAAHIRGPFNENELLFKGVNWLLIHRRPGMTGHLLSNVSIDERMREAQVMAIGLTIRMGLEVGWEITLRKSPVDQAEAGPGLMERESTCTTYLLGRATPETVDPS